MVANKLVITGCSSPSQYQDGRVLVMDDLSLLSLRIHGLTLTAMGEF